MLAANYFSPMHEYTAVFNTPIGKLGVYAEQSLEKISFCPDSRIKKPSNPLSEKVQQQISAYFANPSSQFNLPYLLKGTELQNKIWQELATIPLGTTLTYSDLANRLNTHPRVIGNACRKNPLPIIFPCHRIIAKNNLGGFAGATAGKLLKIKEFLLEHEQRI